MKLGLNELRRIIRDVIVEAKASAEQLKPKPGDKNKPSRLGGIPIDDDEAYFESGLLVNDDVKKLLKKWFKDMGLSAGTKR